MAFKLIAATGTLIGVLALFPVSIHAGQPLPNAGVEALLPSLNDSHSTKLAPVLPPPDQDIGLPEGLRALKRISYNIEAGDTLTKVLVNYGVSLQDRKLWLQSIQKHLPLTAFRPGKEVQLYLTQPEKSREQLKAIEVEQNAD